MLLFGRRLLAPLGRIVEREGHMSHTVLGITMALFCLSTGGVSPSDGAAHLPSSCSYPIAHIRPATCGGWRDRTAVG